MKMLTVMFLISFTTVAMAGRENSSEGVCKTTIYREGGDPSYGNTLKTRVQDLLRLKKVSDHGYTTEDRTLEDCLVRVKKLVEETSDDINKDSRHEFPKIRVTFKSQDLEVKIVVNKSNSESHTGTCKTKVYREGGDPSYGNTLKTQIQDILRIKTVSSEGYTTEDKTLEDCLLRAQKELEATDDDINRDCRHEFPKIKLNFDSGDLNMKLTIKKNKYNFY